SECTPPAAAISESPSSTDVPTTRCLTVSYFQPLTERRWPARNPPPMPYLRLRGRWLERAGFPVGTHVRVSVESRRLVIEAIDEPLPPCAPSRPSRLARLLRALEATNPTPTDS